MDLLHRHRLLLTWLRLVGAQVNRGEGALSEVSAATGRFCAVLLAAPLDSKFSELCWSPELLELLAVHLRERGATPTRGGAPEVLAVEQVVEAGGPGHAAHTVHAVQGVWVLLASRAQQRWAGMPGNKMQVFCCKAGPECEACRHKEIKASTGCKQLKAKKNMRFAHHPGA